MPSIAEAMISPLSGRKRRRDDPNSMEIQMKLSRYATDHNISLLTKRTILTSCISSPHIPRHAPMPPESTTLFNTELVIGDELKHAERRLLVPKMRRCHDSKRQRVERTYPEEDLFLSCGQNFTHTTDRQQHETKETSAKPRIDLSPCHICHRKPTVRSELDAFADCEGCGRRTCYICIRECLGSTPMRDVGINAEDLTGDLDGLPFSFGERMPMGDDGRIRRERNVSGYTTSESVFGFDPGDDLGGRAEWDRQMKDHKGMVCSRCCVERGTEGEVWCMGCLRAEENALHEF